MADATALPEGKVLTVKLRKMNTRDQVGVLLHSPTLNPQPVVKDIQEGSLGTKSDLKLGDLVLKVNSRPVRDHAEATRIVRRANDIVILEVLRPKRASHWGELFCACGRERKVKTAA
jgi:S1-C subfamily serine protease